jgi:hypothetical protein
MRFSIVVDEDETILAASERGEEIDKPRRGAGVSRRSFEISDDLPEAEPHQIVGRLVVGFDANEVTRSPARGEADDTKSA